MGSRAGHWSSAGEGQGPNEDKSSWGHVAAALSEPVAPEGRWGTRENGSSPLELQLSPSLAFMVQVSVKSAYRVACGWVCPPPLAGVGTALGEVKNC